MASWVDKVHENFKKVFPVKRKKLTRKLRFGVPLSEVYNYCDSSFPPSLIECFMKINREGPFKREIFRAPGNLNSSRKLVRALHHGKGANIQNFSVHTVASAIKIFIQRIPNSVYTLCNEELILLTFAPLTDGVDDATKFGIVHKIHTSLSVERRRFLALFYGTLSAINVYSPLFLPGDEVMNANSLGISVAPSLIPSCVSSNTALSSAPISSSATAPALHNDLSRVKAASDFVAFCITYFGMPEILDNDSYNYFSELTRSLQKFVREEEEDLGGNLRWKFLQCQVPSFCLLTSEHHPANSTTNTTLTTTTTEFSCSSSSSCLCLINEDSMSLLQQGFVELSSVEPSPPCTSQPPFSHVSSPSSPSEFTSKTLPRVSLIVTPDNDEKDHVISDHAHYFHEKHLTQDRVFDKIKRRQLQLMRTRSRWFLQQASLTLAPPTSYKCAHHHHSIAGSTSPSSSSMYSSSCCFNASSSHDIDSCLFPSSPSSQQISTSSRVKRQDTITRKSPSSFSIEADIDDADAEEDYGGACISFMQGEVWAGGSATSDKESGYSEKKVRAKHKNKSVAGPTTRSRGGVDRQETLVRRAASMAAYASGKCAPSSHLIVGLKKSSKREEPASFVGSGKHSFFIKSSILTRKGSLQKSIKDLYRKKNEFLLRTRSIKETQSRR